MENKKVIILFSGGLDSTLLVELALAFKMKPLCLLMDYNQVHKQELQVATDYLVEKRIPYVLTQIPLDPSSKLTDGKATYEGVSEWHVPGRNLVFLSFAASKAEERGIDLIWFGANYADRENLFPDCYQEWVYKVNQVMEINGSRKLRVEAPLLGMSKPFIESLVKLFGIQKENTFSGYGIE